MLLQKCIFFTQFFARTEIWLSETESRKASVNLAMTIFKDCLQRKNEPTRLNSLTVTGKTMGVSNCSGKAVELYEAARPPVT